MSVWVRVCLVGAMMTAAMSAAADSKVIYGADDRIDVYAETNPDRLEWAASTVALVTAFDLTQNPNGTFTLNTDPFTISGRQPCIGEPFANQRVASYCSGFLAADDVIVTAGHCFDANRLSTTRFVFGFDMENAVTATTTFTSDQVYAGVEILARQLDTSGADFAVIRLDRPVSAPGAQPLPIRRVGVIGVGTQVGVIGHPSGLPKKIAFGAQTQVKSNNEPGFFSANLDTYGGNSGSPVFNALTGVVEGVLVRGETDYNFVGSCFESNRVSDNSSGEDVTKTTVFASAVPVTSEEGEEEGSPEGSVEGAHSADSNGNLRISLSELLRVVQLYNANVYSCASNSEDGYAPQVGLQDCEPHDSDFNGETDFVISLTELMRCIQLYNADGYTVCGTGEDGFCI